MQQDGCSIVIPAFSARTRSINRSTGIALLTHAVFTFLLVLIYSAVNISVVQADSPPNIITDIAWTDTGGAYNPGAGQYAATFNGVVDIQAAYNHARRQEEIQLSLPANTLGNLTLPTQAVWDTYSDDLKALTILNAERIARSGMMAGVIGLPFAGIEVNIDNLAQTHADYLVSSNTTGHLDGAGNDPFVRISNDSTLGPCHEFVSRAENIASFWTGAGSNPLYIERAIYNWVYADAGSAWGHREAVLLQDKDVANQSPSMGFNNNVLSALDEGYIGIGMAESASYDPYGWGWVKMGTVVVLDMFDPISTGSCPWDLAPTATATNTPVPPTATPTATATNTPVPPTATPTATPTNTPVPPTATPTATATNTLVPPTATPTATPTNTPVPPTATPTATPTNTPVPPTATPTATPTNTLVPPTATPTATPTNTPVPPTATPVPPTATPVLPTATPVPPTNTPVPPTATPIPPTATPVPPTATPVPPTNTPVPPTTTPIPPTATPVPPTATPVPPTATPVPPTATPVPPTATPVPPTATPVPPTATPVPPTATPVPPTATPVPPTRRPVQDLS